MSDDEIVVNFRDDAELQQAMLSKCKRLGTSRSEVLREFCRNFVDGGNFDTPEGMLARADKLESEADDVESEVEHIQSRAERKSTEAERLRREARELRERAEDAGTYDEDIEALGEFMQDGDRHLFPEHKRVTTVANDHGVSPPQVLDDVQEETGLPAERFEKAGPTEV